MSTLTLCVCCVALRRGAGRWVSVSIARQERQEREERQEEERRGRKEEQGKAEEQGKSKKSKKAKKKKNKANGGEREAGSRFFFRLPWS